ncbi:MAG: hypothetical protein NVSMB44_17240 [Ktedonobacteraceae bacterium]
MNIHAELALPPFFSSLDKDTRACYTVPGVQLASSIDRMFSAVKMVEGTKEQWTGPLRLALA